MGCCRIRQIREEWDGGDAIRCRWVLTGRGIELGATVGLCATDMFFGAKMFAEKPEIVWCDVGVRLDWIGEGREGWRYVLEGRRKGRESFSMSFGPLKLGWLRCRSEHISHMTFS